MYMPTEILNEHHLLYHRNLHTNHSLNFPKKSKYVIGNVLFYYVPAVFFFFCVFSTECISMIWTTFELIFTGRSHGRMQSTTQIRMVSCCACDLISKFQVTNQKVMKKRQEMNFYFHHFINRQIRGICIVSHCVRCHIASQIDNKNLFKFYITSSTFGRFCWNYNW